MAEQQTGQKTNINWSVVGFGVIILILVVAAVEDTFFRVVLAAGIMVLTFYWSQSRQEAEVENPLLERLHETQHGLDRRKYGRLRATTDSLLDHVREMNRIAVEGREGKLAPRHTHAELDRLAAKMRDLVDEIRKTAGVPTPMGAEGPRRSQPPQPQVVIPKARREPPAAETPQPQSEPPRPPSPASPSGEEGSPAPSPKRSEEDDASLDELAARAEREARAREAERAGKPAPQEKPGPNDPAAGG